VGKKKPAFSEEENSRCPLGKKAETRWKITGEGKENEQDYGSLHEEKKRKEKKRHTRVDN